MDYALVTGASRGIGKAIALQLSRDGYAILVNYVSNAEAAAEVVSEITAAGGTAQALQFDVADGEACRKAIQSWQEAHKGEYIKILVNNAGIRRDNILALMDEKAWSDVVNPTVNGFYNVTSCVISQMMRKRWGRIITLSSLSGQKGLPGQTNYSAAKAAVIGATKALSQEVASRGITVNAVAPGFISTDMTKGLDEEGLKTGIPMQRFGRPEEVADLVSFLASERASYITGEVIAINGGLYT